MSNASKNGISEEKNIRTVQNIPSSVKDVNKCICKHEISEALKFKNTFRWLQLCFSMIMKHRQSKNCGSAGHNSVSSVSGIRNWTSL